MPFISDLPYRYLISISHIVNGSYCVTLAGSSGLVRARPPAAGSGAAASGPPPPSRRASFAASTSRRAVLQGRVEAESKSSKAQKEFIMFYFQVLTACRRGLQGQLGVDLGSTRGQLGVNLGSTWGQIGVNLGPTWGQPRVNPGSTWGQPAPPHLTPRLSEDVPAAVAAQVTRRAVLRVVPLLATGRFRYVAWDKRPYKVAGRESALRAGKPAPGLMPI